MIGRIYEFADLQRFTQYKRVADVEACLERQRIKFFHGRNGPWTTEDAINAALGISPTASNDGAYRPDDLL